MASAFEMFAAGDALEYMVLQKTPDTLELNVTECRYAEFYKKTGAPTAVSHTWLKGAGSVTQRTMHESDHL